MKKFTFTIWIVNLLISYNDQHALSI